MEFPNNITQEVALFRCPVCKAWVVAQVGIQLRGVKPVVRKPPELSQPDGNLSVDVTLASGLVGFGVEHRCGEVMMPDDDAENPRFSREGLMGRPDVMPCNDEVPVPVLCGICRQPVSNHAPDGSCYTQGTEKYRAVKDNPQA